MRSTGRLPDARTVAALALVMTSCAGASTSGSSDPKTKDSATATSSTTASAESTNQPLVPTSSASASETVTDEPGPGGFTKRAVALCQVVNQYRVSEGMVAAPISVALMTVAARHAADLHDHPELSSKTCTARSWSKGDEFAACCAEPSAPMSDCMTQKPKQITSSWGKNQYAGSGFEFVVDGASTPEAALDKLKNTADAHAALVNTAPYDDKSPWSAIGCAMKGNIAVVWFGDATDKQRL